MSALLQLLEDVPRAPARYPTGASPCTPLGDFRPQTHFRPQTPASPNENSWCRHLCFVYKLTGWRKKRPELCVTIMAHILYTEKFIFADL